MQIVFENNDNVRLNFEAACTRLGEGFAKSLYSKVLNTKGRKAHTAVKRALAIQTSIKPSLINGQTRFSGARSNSLITQIIGTGRAVPLRMFGPSQGPVGVSATVWGKTHTVPHTFIIAQYGGGVYKRVGARRGPVEQLYGPAIPVELIKDASLEAFNAVGEEIMPEVIRLTQLMLDGTVKMGGGRY